LGWSISRIIRSHASINSGVAVDTEKAGRVRRGARAMHFGHQRRDNRRIEFEAHRQIGLRAVRLDFAGRGYVHGHDEIARFVEAEILLSDRQALGTLQHQVQHRLVDLIGTSFGSHHLHARDSGVGPPAACAHHDAAQFVHCCFHATQVANRDRETTRCEKIGQNGRITGMGMSPARPSWGGKRARPFLASYPEGRSP
jgi:hypothetical protein